MSQRGAAAVAALVSGALDAGRARFEAAARAAAVVGRHQANGTRSGKRGGDLVEALVATRADVARGGETATRTACAILQALKGTQNGPHRKFLLRIFRWLAQSLPISWAHALAEALEEEDIGQDAQLEGLLIVRGAFGSETVTFKDLAQQPFVDACAADAQLLKAVARIMRDSVDRDERSRFAGRTPLAAAASDIFMLCVLQLCRQIHAREKEKSIRNAAILGLWAQRAQICVHLELLHQVISRENAPSSTLFLMGLQDLRDDIALVAGRKTDGREPGPLSAALAAHLLASGSALVHADPAWEDADIAAQEVSTCLAELDVTTQRTQALAAAAVDEATAEDRRFELDHIAKVQVRRLCLLLGRMRPQVRATVASQCGSDLLQLAARQLGRSSGTSAGLASTLVSTVLETLCEPPAHSNDSAQDDVDERVGKGYASLFALLKSEDTIADCAADIIASGAIRFPHQLLPDLIGIAALSSSSLAEREKALLALQFYVARNSGSLEPFTDVLRTRLLELVGSEQLKLRLASGKVLGQTDPASIVPFLCGLTTRMQSNATARSAASAALEKVFEYHENTLAVFEAWFACATTIATKAVVNSPKKENGDAEAEADAALDRVRDTAKMWGRSVPAHVWPAIFRVIWRAACTEPESSGPIGVARRLASPYFAMNAAKCISEDVLPFMQTQQELTEDLLGNNAQDTAVRDLLFARLSPLLFLTMLPLSTMFAPTSTESTEIAEALLLRCIAVYEFKEVRQVAAQALARLHRARVAIPVVLCGLKWFVDQTANPALEAAEENHSESEEHIAFLVWTKALQRLESNPNNDAIIPVDVSVAKALVVTAQYAFAQEPSGKCPQKLVDQLFHVFAKPCRDPQSPLANLQEGCIILLSSCAVGTPDAWKPSSKAKALVQEVDPGHGVTASHSQNQPEPMPSPRGERVRLLYLGPEVFDAVVEHVCRGRHAALASIICGANVILTCLRRATEDSSPFDFPHAILEMTSESRLLQPICSALQRLLGSVPIDEHGQASAALVQILFTACLLRSKANSDEGGSDDHLSATQAQQLCSLVLGGLDDARSQVRGAMVKLAGALLTLPEASLRFPDGAMAGLMKKLSGLANMDIDAEVRLLASKLAQQM